MEHWCNNADRGENRSTRKEEILSQCHFVYHKSHIKLLGIECGNPKQSEFTKSETSEDIFVSNVYRFPTEHCSSWKVPRFCPFVLLVRVTCRAAVPTLLCV